MRSDCGIIAAAALLSLSCCCVNSHGPEAVRAHRQAGMLDAWLTGPVGDQTLHWRFTNRLSHPVWVPVVWDDTYPRSIKLPMAFLLPTEELLFVSGDLRFSTPELRVHTKGNAGVETARIDPGNSIAGHVALKTPYALQRHVRSPCEFPPDEATSLSTASKVCTEASGIRVAMQYWLSDPAWTGRLPRYPYEREVYARTLAIAVIEGRQEYFVMPQGATMLLVTEKLPVSILLKEPLTVYAEKGYYDELLPWNLFP